MFGTGIWPVLGLDQIKDQKGFGEIFEIEISVLLGKPSIA